jgi:hypothetical protein
MVMQVTLLQRPSVAWQVEPWPHNRQLIARTLLTGRQRPLRVQPVDKRRQAVRFHLGICDAGHNGFATEVQGEPKEVRNSAAAARMRETIQVKQILKATLGPAFHGLAEDHRSAWSNHGKDGDSIHNIAETVRPPDVVLRTMMRQPAAAQPLGFWNSWNESQAGLHSSSAAKLRKQKDQRVRPLLPTV